MFLVQNFWVSKNHAILCPFFAHVKHRQGPDGPPQAVKATMKKFDSRGKLRLYPDEMKASRQGVYWCLLEMRDICNTRNVCV